MVIRVNDEPRELPDGATVDGLIELLRTPDAGRGVAVALDGEVVPRTAWSSTTLCEGSQVEVLTAVQGG